MGKKQMTVTQATKLTQAMKATRIAEQTASLKAQLAGTVEGINDAGETVIVNAPKASKRGKHAPPSTTGVKTAKIAEELAPWVDADAAKQAELDLAIKAAKTLQATIASFPARFGVKAEKGLFRVNGATSTIDEETGEELLAVERWEPKGDKGSFALLGKFSPEDLRSKLVELKAGVVKEAAKKAAKAPKSPTEKREGNIDMMARLILADVGDVAILAEFTARYAAQNVEHKNAEWIAARVRTYHSIAAERADVALALTAQAERAAQAAPKGKKSSKKAAK